MPDNCPILEAHGVKLNDIRGGAEVCRNCPLERCIYDEKRESLYSQRKRLRDQEVIRLFTTERKRIKELALMFNVGRQTIHRIIKDYRHQRKKV